MTGKINVRRFSWLTLSIAVLLFAGCGRNAPRNPALIILPGARDIIRGHVFGTDQLSYRLNEAYPADSALRNIKDQLTRQGWKPLKEDYLNPGLPSSHTRGWTEFIDATRKPEQMVKQWLADWTNDKGDIVTYALRYRFPSSGSLQLNTLLITAIYDPAKSAQDRRSHALKEMKKEQEQP